MKTGREVAEENQSLWLIAASPAVQAVHFLLSYATAAIWCGKFVGPGGSIASARLAISVYTVIALIAIGVSGWTGYRRRRLGPERAPDHTDTPEDRHRFLGAATLLLSALSAVATVYVAFAAVFIRSCH
jgi:hypothetical protein